MMGPAMDALLSDLEAQLREHWADEERWAVYADALLQAGDPRGELISLELRLARREQASLRAELDALLAAHEQQWRPKYGYERGPEGLGWQYGFVTRLRTHELTEAEDVESLTYVLGEPQLRMLRALELQIGEHVELDLFPALARLELGRLRALRLAYARRGDALGEVLACVPPTLVELDLRHIGLTEHGLGQVLEHLQARGCRLQHLHLQHNELGPKAVGMLARSAALTQLRHLDLRGNELGPEGARVLATAPRLGRLERLLLDARDIDSEGEAALAGSDTLAPAITRFWRARRGVDAAGS